MRFSSLEVLNSIIYVTLISISFATCFPQQPLQPQDQRPPRKGSNYPSLPISSSASDDEVIVRNCRSIKGVVNRLYERAVRKDEPLVFIFYVDRKYFQDAHNTNLRIEMEVDYRTTLNEPVLFAVGQRKYISTFELPQVFGTENVTRSTPIYYTAGRTLCIQRKDAIIEGQNITVRVTTSSIGYISYRLKLHLTSDFQLPMGKEIYLDVSPSNTKYLGFQSSRPDLGVVKIKASSATGSCMTLSIQPPHCPIYDKEASVRHKGLWQTMSFSAAMTLELVNRFKDGFVVVLVAHDSDSRCSKSGYINPYDLPPMPGGGTNSVAGGTNNKSPIFGAVFGSGPSPRSKNVTLIITNESSVSGWIVFLVMAIPVFVTILLVVLVTCLFRNRHNWMRVEAEKQFRLAESESGFISSAKESGVARPQRLNMQPSDDLVLHDLGVLPSPTEDPEDADSPESRLNSSRGEGILSPTIRRQPSDYLKAPIERFYEKKDGQNSGGRIRWRANLKIGDFNQKNPFDTKKSGRRFYWTIVIVAIFYCIPVYQLILHYLRVLYRTGDYDLCYYNYLCSHRLGLFIDFNHFWSNISYIIFGLAFIFLVGRRAHAMSLVKISTRQLSRRKRTGGATGYIVEYDDQTHPGYLKRCCGYAKIPTQLGHGIPHNWGIFYALGVALAMEGVLSSAYHLCPNQSSFQFDTCFMYVISVLILLKIYQFRHSVYFGANHTFLILAAFVLISVIGLMFEFQGDGAKKAYRWTFIGFQFVAMLLIATYFYSFGYIRSGDNQGFLTDIRILRNLGQLKDQQINGDRLILPLISLLLGIAVLIYCELTNIDFATYLLYVLVSNVIGSTLYYVGIMKPLHGEFKNNTWVQPCLYFLGAGIIGGFAVNYFVRSPAAWELSAAASRAGNEECMGWWFPFYPYYDSHDVWHFLSAAALFLSFMALLIVDDDLLTTPQDKIHVF